MNDSRGRARPIVLAGVAALAALLAYLPALAAGFTSDDFSIVALLQTTGGLNDAGIYFQRGFYDYYRPIAFLSHGLDWELWGMRPTGFHLTNICLHAANSALVFAVGRRLLSPLWALAAALLFGLHPSSHEAVYWIAARFDLLATCFGLIALLALTSRRPAAFGAGVIAFGLALLSKESAAAIPLVVVAHDVWIARRARFDVIRRVAPLLAVMGGYALLRAIAADVPPTGGRVAKLALFAAALAALLLLARAERRDESHEQRSRQFNVTGPWMVPALSAALAIGAVTPATSVWVREKLTFVAYAAFHLLSPVAQPPPPPFFLDPATPVYWMAGLAVCVTLAAIAWRLWPLLRRHEESKFIIVFVLAALLPVSTMTGGTRYLYLASAGTSLGAAFLAQSLTLPWRRVMRVSVVAALTVAPIQIVLAGRAWIWASEMSAGAVAAVAPRLAPCGTVDLVLLTAPAQIRGVYSNLNVETFSTAGCAPARLQAITRIVRDDVPIEVTSTAGVLEWHVPIDRGNIVASRDLRTFDIRLRSPDAVVISTPLGRLESRVEGAARRFRFEPVAGTAPRVFAYYGGGRVRVLPGTLQ